MSSKKLRAAWNDMNRRCYNEDCISYIHYGGRGIKVCDEWLGENGFENFRNWSLLNGYFETKKRGECTLDRIDVNGDYCPENCRWVDISTQNANRRNAGKCEYIGVHMHSLGNHYCASIKYHGKVLFTCSARSKNDCARKRNEYIIEHNLPHPLNIIKDEYEDVRPDRYTRIYTAINKETGEVIENSDFGEFSNQVELSKGFIQECIKGNRNSKKYIFKKRMAYEDSSR